MHCWLHVTKEHIAVTGAAYSAYVSLLCQLDTTARLHPLRHLHGSLDRLRRKLHCSNGRLADGTNKDPSVRESTGRGSVSEKRSPTTVAPLVSFQYSIHPCWAHLSGSNACVRVLLCSIKGRRPLEKDSGPGRSPAGQRIDSFIPSAIHHTVDVGYYTPAARTTLNSCVLAFLPPN